MKKNNLLVASVLIAIVLVIVFLETNVSSQYGDNVDSDIAVLDYNERIAQKIEKYDLAKELVDPDGFINSEEFNLTQYIGNKIILIDFWTYSCINCQRTLPYVNSWWEKYQDDGLLIVGVHTPEFAFEEEYENVLEATQKYGVNYPVVLDNDYKTWRAYQNRYWPRKYLIDIDGFIVYDHIGEGAYEQTEKKIQELLLERTQVLQDNLEIETSISDPDRQFVNYGGKRTPEIYFGYGFERGQLGNTEGWQKDKIVKYTLPQEYEADMFYLEGMWQNNREGMLAINNSVVVLSYTAYQVNAVAGGTGTIEVYAGDNLIDTILINSHDLYTLYETQESTSQLLTLKVSQGVELFTFTFG